jgi:hypothetical protein
VQGQRQAVSNRPLHGGGTAQARLHGAGLVINHQKGKSEFEKAGILGAPKFFPSFYTTFFQFSEFSEFS